jgi:hypothetical protein
MKWRDLEDALMFLDVRDQIVIQCPTAHDVPYIKRGIMMNLGEPDRIIGNTLYYGSKRIIVCPVLYSQEHKTLGFNSESMFYIGWISEMDIEIAEENGIVFDDRPRVLQLWKDCGMSFGDIFNALKVDGWHEIKACDHLHNFIRGRVAWL